jgi:TRAP-type mannitol/chloroaromatic compound transport system permease small subunit
VRGHDQLVELYRDNHPDRSIMRAWVDIVGELVFRIPAIRLAVLQSFANVEVTRVVDGGFGP